MPDGELLLHCADGSIDFEVRLQPRASRDAVEGVREGRLLVRTTAPPLEGRANGRLVRLLAEYFDLSRSRITILSGEHSRVKRVRIEGCSTGEIEARMADLRT